MSERFFSLNGNDFFLRTSRNHKSAVIYYENGNGPVTYTLAELAIFHCQRNGLTDQEIANQLEISVHTVTNTVANCRTRNGQSTVGLVLLAESLTLLDQDSLAQLYQAYEDMR
ncbi:MAG: hypothetical protein AAB874_04200 [Patescibacteria group bacterium]